MRKGILTALGLAVPLALAPGAMSWAGPPGPSGHPAATGTSSAVETETTLRLITGDVVRVGSRNGRPSVQAVSANRRGIAGQLQVIRSGTQVYVIPGAARRYLGGSIDPSMFDVTALEKAQRQGRTPVRLSFAAGARHAVPGVTMIGQDSGYVTASSAGAFGKALVAQWTSDAAHPAKTLFGGLTRIGLDAPATPVAHPDYPQVTLIIKVNDENGKPLSDGEVDLMNADDSSRFTGFLPVVNGEARASVPLGNYSAISSIDNYDAHTDTALSYLISVGDYRVDKDMQTLRISAAKTTKLAISTPRPAGTTEQSAEWFRADKIGGGLDSSFSYGTGSAIYVTPTPAVGVGQLYWLTGWTLNGGPAQGLAYSYDASFLETGRISANQAHTVTRADAAVVDSRYYTDGPSWNSAYGRAAVYPFQFGYFSTFNPQPSPLHRTEYVVGPKEAQWQASLLADPTEDNPFAGEVDDGFRSYAPGSLQTADWLRGALAPGVADSTIPGSYWYCAACRTSTSLSLDLAPVLDSTPGHSGAVDVPTKGHAARFRLYRDGKLIDDENDSTGGVFTVPAAPAKYRVVDTVQRAQERFAGSTTSTVDVSFASTAGSGGELPNGWECSADGSGACTIPSILQANVPLPTDLTGQLPVGPSVTSFTVGHIQGAPSSVIHSAALQLSFDGGKSWHTQPSFAEGGGRYRAVLSNPASAAGHRIGVRITATDTGGGSLTQTVANAYAVSAH